MLSLHVVFAEELRLDAKLYQYSFIGKCPMLLDYISREEMFVTRKDMQNRHEFILSTIIASMCVSWLV